MKSKFYISAIYTSPPTSMGGNTKIMLEMINNLISRFDFIIFTTEPDTFKKNLTDYSKVKIIPIEYKFTKFNYASHLNEVKYIFNIYNKFFKENKINKNDYFLTPSDFAPDVIPVYKLRNKYKFKWLASLFLFIPSPWENLKNKYKFPFLKYIIYFLYQRYIFFNILKKGDLFLITNDFDRKYFPNKLKKRIFAVYGGVNTEQITKAKEQWNGKKTYDAVYCSRLHPQKGISGILNIWRKVIKIIPDAKLAIIGNGEMSYEIFLKNKAKKLGIDKNISWLGYINGVEKYKIYLQSNIFLHGTVYDNNGMVAAEALCSGLPVIMYDLPQLESVYRKGCIKVKTYNQEMYVEFIVKTLKGNTNLKTNKKLLEYWDWKNRIKKLSSFIN